MKAKAASAQRGNQPIPVVVREGKESSQTKARQIVLLPRLTQRQASIDAEFDLPGQVVPAGQLPLLPMVRGENLRHVARQGQDASR